MAGTFSHPFSDSSLWNTPISNLNPTYSDPNAVQNTQFKDAGLANTSALFDHVVYNTPSDAPTATWTFNTLNTTAVGGNFSTNGSVQIQTPADLQFTHGADGWSVFSDGAHSWETWGGSFDAATNTYHAAYLVENDVANGTGWGNVNTGAGAGIRASGASLLGGVVSQSELNNLSIPHALAIELDASQLKAATGSTNAGQFTAPAVNADGNSVSAYSGSIPIGSHFALPANLDLSAAGLTPEGLALAKAYQSYGGYVVDMAGHTTSLAEFEPGTAQQQADVFKDLGWIRDHLVMTSDQGQGASNAAAPADAAAAMQANAAQADTHQAPADAAAGTVAAPADAAAVMQANGAQADTHQAPADAAAGTVAAPAGAATVTQANTAQADTHPATAPVDVTAGTGVAAADTGASDMHQADAGAGAGMHAALASLAKGMVGATDANQTSISHALASFNPHEFAAAARSADGAAGNNGMDQAGWGHHDTGTTAGMTAAAASLLGGMAGHADANQISMPQASATDAGLHQLAAATGAAHAGQPVQSVSADSASYAGTAAMGGHFGLPGQDHVDTTLMHHQAFAEVWRAL